MRKIYVLLLTVLFAATSNAQNVTVNPGAGSYVDMASAFAAINAGTHTGAITIDIVGNTTEPAGGAILNASGTGSASYTSILIQPSGGAARTISGAATAGVPLIDFNGADNVTINGLNTGGNSLTISNTTVSATSGTSTIRFQTDATNNTITNCSILGSSTMATTTNGGNIWFGAGSTTTGNDNNTISNCNIGPAGSNLPTKLIYGNGSTTTTTVYNSGNLITGNNLFDYFNAASQANAVYLAGGNTTWTVSNNRIYQTATRTQTTGAILAGIQAASSTGNDGHTISGNIIGFSNSAGTGTTNLVGIGTGSKFLGIYISSASTTTPISIQGNTVAGIVLSGVVGGTGTTGSFVGISVASGVANIGNVTGNTVGSLSSAGSISVTSNNASAMEVYGIYYFPSQVANLSNNNVGGIVATNSGAGALDVYGIRAFTSSSVTNTITNNTVGSNSAPLSNTSSSTSSNTYGIYSQSGIAVVTGNTISNLTMNAANIGTGSSAAMIGLWISNTSATAGNNVAQNNITSLSHTDAAAAVWVTGLHYNGSTTGTHIVQRNFIHTISSASSSATATVNGLNVEAGATTFRNNMIAIGSNMTSNSPQINGFNETGGTDNFYHNSVYIGGSGVAAGSANSFAFNSVVTTNTRNFISNIFYNARSNAAATGKHYATRVGGTAPSPAGLTSNGNILFANGTGGFTGLFNAVDQLTLADWQTATAQDGSSLSSNPQYINPTAATPDLHLQTPSPAEGSGVSVAVTDDYDGQTRATLTPVDIGADAGNFFSYPVIVYTPLGSACAPGARTLTATITDPDGVPTSGIGLPVLYWRINAGVYSGATGVSLGGGQYQFSFGAGAVMGDVVSYYIAAQDNLGNTGSSPSAGAGGFTANPPAAATPPASPSSYSLLALSGTYTVGAVGNYTTLTAAVNAYNSACLTGPVIFNLIDATYPSEVFPIVINANSFASAVNTLTIKPASGVTATISGSATGGLIRILGSHVTFDGSNNGSTSRDLTITNTGVTTPSVLLIGSTGVTPIINVGLKNSVIINGVNTSSAVVVSDGATAGNAGYFNNITIQNNSIQRAYIGLFCNAVVAAGNGNISITSNDVNTSGANAVRICGLYVQGTDGAVISQNNVGNLETTSAENDVAIWMATGAGNTTVSGNTVVNMSYTGTGSQAPYGIRESSGLAASGNNITGNTVSTITTTGGTAVFGIDNSGSGTIIQKNNVSGVINSNTGTFGAYGINVSAGNNAIIRNNFVSNINFDMTGGAAFSTTFGVFGIRLGAGTGHQVYHNSVNMYGAIPGTANSSLLSAAFAIVGTGSTGCDVRNNIFANNLTGGTTSIAHVSAFLPSGGGSAMNLNWNNNAYFFGTDVARQGVGQAGTTAGTNFYTTLAALTAYSSTLAPGGTNDNASKASSGAVPYLSTTDLHINNAVGANWCLNGTGANVSVVDDIDNQARSNPPDIGADEFVSVGDATATPSSQTICSGATITTIVPSGTAVSFNWSRDNNVSVTGIAASGTGSISGALTNTTTSPVTVTFTITPVDAGGCFGPSTTATVLVNPSNTISLTSAVGTDAQTVCLNTAITNITYATTVATGATFSGLPAGVTGSWAANVVTISGTPTTTVGSPFNYTVTLTGGGSCGTLTATGTITVMPDNTITLTSAPGTDAQTVCINTAITNITYATTGATGATVTGLPAGVTGSWAANVVTISGTPTTTVGSPFSYTVTLTGGCGSVTANGTITVNPDNTINLTSAPGTDAQTVCINTPITNITYSTTGATGATVTGLPAGVTGSWAANVVTISGTPTTAVGSPFSYTVTLTGGCGSITANGTITVTPNNTVTLTSAAGTNAQIVCVNTPITNITYSTTGATGATVTGLPAGVTGSWAANVVTISGTPTTTVGSPFSYTVTLTGGCGSITANGTITVQDPPVVNAPTVTQPTVPTPTGTIVVNATGGPTLEYSVNGAGGPYQLSNTFTGLTPGGSYNVAVRIQGSTGCVVLYSGNPIVMNSVNGRVTDVLVGSSPFQDSLWTINLANYTILRRLGPTLAGFTITGMNGIATNPLTGEHFIIMKVSGVSGRVLGKVNVQTGVCTQIGNMGDNFSTLAFKTNGELYSITGNGSSTLPAETMYKIDTLTGAPTFYRTLGNGADGEVIAFNPDDNFFYHWSGNGTVVWEKFQNDTDPIQPLTTPVNGEVFGALYAGAGKMWVSSISSDIRLWDIPTQTASAVLMNTPDDLRGLVRESCASSITAGGPTTFCSGGSVLLTVNGGTGSYQWYQNGAPIGSANSSTYSATTSGLYNCIYMDGCGLTDSVSLGISIIVDPTPDVTAVPSSQTVCAGSATTAIVFSGSVPGTVYNWTNNTTSIGLAASGSGDIASFTAVNAGTAPVTATITVTPTANGCTGTPITVTITVNPIPTVDPVANQTLCNGANTAAINFSGAVAGTVYSWTNNTPSIGLAASGSGNIASFTATNATAVPVVATITVTPSYTNAGTTCTGTPTNLTITVNPTPDAVATPASQTICSGAITPIVLTGAVSGTTFNWTRDNTVAVTGIAASGSGDISGTLTNTTTAPVTVTFTITPTANGCTGAAITATVVVNPIPTVDPVANQTICNGANTAAINFTGSVAGTVYNWVNTNPAIGLAASGSGNIASFTGTNAGTTPISGTITVTPVATYGGGGPITTNFNFTGGMQTWTVPAGVTSVFVQSWGAQGGSGALGGNSVAGGAGALGGYAEGTLAVTPGQVLNIFVGGQGATPTGGYNGGANGGTLNAGGGGGASDVRAGGTGAANRVITAGGGGGGGRGGCHESGGTGGIGGDGGVGGGGVGQNGNNSAQSSGVAGGGQGGNFGSVQGALGAAGIGCAGFLGQPGVTTASENGGNGGSGQTCCCSGQNAQPGGGGGGGGQVGGGGGGGGSAGTTGCSGNSKGAGGGGGGGSSYIGGVTSGVTNNGIWLGNGMVSISYATASTCTGPSTSFTITVNPTPDAVATPASQEACSGTPITTIVLTSAVSGTTFNWTRDMPGVTGIAASGSGNISGTLTNATASPVTVTFTITPIANGCAGNPITATVTVNPTPDATATPSSQTICSGTAITPIVLSGTLGGTTFNWTRNNTVAVTGIAASGSGDISGTLTNTTNAPVVVTFTITPVASGCSGTPITATVTVNPTPTVNGVANQTVCNNAATTPVNFTGAVAGTIFSWTNNTPSIGLPASGTGNIPSFIATNPGPGPVTATITVTPSTNSNNFSQAFNFTGAVQTWVVPAGVTSINVQAFGGQGRANAAGISQGGLGGMATGTLAVTPGETLWIYVGGGGGSGTTGGFNGGGTGGTTGTCLTAAGGGGGGASDLRQGVDNLASRRIVAGGGGGTAGNRVAACSRGAGGGGGGGYYGGGGGSGYPGTTGVVPTGGTQAAGGAGGITGTTFGATNGLPGALGLGGTGGNEAPSNQAGSQAIIFGSGAGGGLTGGPGQQSGLNNFTGQSGAGGSAYIGGVTAGITSSGVRSGNGAVTISYVLPGVPVICTGAPTTFTITVNPSPTITCPANVTVNSTPGQCGAIVTYPPATATGIPAPVITYSIPSGSFFPAGVTTVTATATNTCGTATCTFTVTVVDVQAPTVTCPGNVTVSNTPNLCSAVVNYSFPTFTDNCQQFQAPATILPHGGGAITVAGNNLPGGFYFDLSNNTATPKLIGSFQVRFGTSTFGVVASPAPVSVFVTTSANTYVGNQTNAAAWTTIGAGIPVTVAGANSEFSTVTLPGGGFILPPNTTRGIYLFGTVSSLVYNSAANSNFTPITNGVLTLTPGQASSGLFVAALSPRTPNVRVNYITLSQTAASGSTFPVGTTPVTYTVTDDGGNSASCTFNVTVLDTQAPTVNCPAPITVTTPVGSCTAIVNYTVTASDNCPGAVAQLVSGPASGSAFPIGTTTVTWRAVDAAGNISLSNCSFTVTVLDGQLPVISAQPANRTVCVGTSATFSVTSSNALTYQWQAWNSVTQTWSDIPGATSSTYTVNNVTHSMNTNSYRVRIAGLCTTILSNHATLTVNPLPMITISTSIQPTLLPTQTVILTANGNPGGGTYVWFKNNVVIPGATSQTLGPLGIADLGTYKVTYTDPNGCVNTSADVVVKAQPSSGIVVFPNPNNGQFNVRFYNTTSQFATVHVYNAVGQRMLLSSERFTLTAQSYNTLPVRMAQFVADGTYEVVVLDDKNQRIDVERIIVANQ